MEKNPYQRTCDMCDTVYIMNNKEIPRIMVFQKIDINDLTSKDFISSPDYCPLCILVIMRMLQRKRKLTFKLNTTRFNPSELQIIGNR